MIYESERKMTYKEQEAYDLGYTNGKRAAMCSPWVKTSDRLPDDNKPVLVTYVGYTDNLPYNDAIAVYAHENSDNYAGAWYWQDSDGVDDNPVSVSITHWMPIPPLPEEQHLRALHGNVFNAKNQFFGNVENLFDS